MGVTSLVAGYYLSELFSRFRRHCPAVEVFVTEDTPRFLEHLLINGEIDVAIMVSNALSEPQAMVCETLTRSRNRVWLPSNHALAAQDEVSLADCAACDQIVLEADRIDELMARVWARHQLKPRMHPAHRFAGSGALAGRRRRRHRRAARHPVPAVDTGCRACRGAPAARRDARPSTSAWCGAAARALKPAATEFIELARELARAAPRVVANDYSLTITCRATV